MRFQVALTLTLWGCGWSTTAVYAFVPDDDLSSSPDDATNVLWLSKAPSTSDMITMQASLQERPHPQNEFALGSQSPLLDQEYLTGQDVLSYLLPDHRRLRTALIRSHRNGQTLHERYDLRLGPWPLYGAYLDTHHVQDKLVGYKLELPSAANEGEIPDPKHFLPLDSLELGPDLKERLRDLSQMSSNQVVALYQGQLAPAWHVRGYNLRSQVLEEFVVTANEGKLVTSCAASFKLANVYKHNPIQSPLTTVELEDLLSNTFLDGIHVSIYSPTASDPRAQGDHGNFLFHPDVETEAIAFDAAQSYYTVSQALQWFSEKVHHDKSQTKLTIRINHPMGGRKDNAFYVPTAEGAEIHIAQSDKLANLTRDVDVLNHEVSHHIIYDFVTTTYGDAGVLHEGIADYFAYAMTGDPYLGESLSPSKPFLRTADPAEKGQYDLLPNETKAHSRGSYWSSLLWSLRSHIGPEMTNAMVYQSLGYMSPNPSLKEGILALLSVDHDLMEAEAQSLSFSGTFGANRCLILKTASDLGFHQALGDLDGSGCGLDLQKLAEYSRRHSKLDKDKSNKKSHFTLETLGRSCGILGTETQNRNKNSWILLIPLLGYFFMRPISTLWKPIPSYRGRLYGTRKNS